MEEQKREIRYTGGGMSQPRLREAAENGGSGRTIEGYAVVFDVESRLLVDWWAGDYREIIEKGAITEEELKGMDIKMTLWHNRERLIARSNKGEGTLKLSVNDKGVKYEFEAPDTPDGNTALELVKRGDLAGSSFTYWSDETSSVRYSRDKDDLLIRHVKHLDMVYEMTIASDPAYIETSVTAREVEAGGVELREKKEKPKEIHRESKLSMDKDKRRRLLTMK